MDSASYRYSRVWFENVIFPTSTLPVFKKRASYASCSLSLISTWFLFLCKVSPVRNVSSASIRNPHCRTSGLVSISNFFTTYTRETLTTKTFYKLFLFEKQVRLENDPDILNETFDVEINDIAVDNNSAKVTAYEYYEYELSYADGEKKNNDSTDCVCSLSPCLPVQWATRK